MKSLLSVFSCFSLFFSAAGHAAESCGQYAGRHIDSAANGAISRTVVRYQTPTGYRYVYVLEFDGIFPASIGGDLAFRLEVHMNGEDAIIPGSTNCTTASAIVGSDSCGSDITAAPGLFTYAANGDVLNAWDVAVLPIDPATGQGETPTTVRFAETGLDQMDFGN